MAAIKIPKTAIVQATKQHTATLFFFHGSGNLSDVLHGVPLGGLGKDLKQWVDILNRGELKFPHIKIIYPTAPAQPYTPLGGMMSNVWFNRKDISIHAPEEKESIDSMCNLALELIEKEVSSGIPHDRIALGGFSMGGALSLYLTYRFLPTVAGCTIMSSFLNKNSVVYQDLKINQNINKPPLLQLHGTADDLVPLEWGEETYRNLKELGVNVKFLTLNNTGHEITRNGVETFKKWLLDILPEQ